MTIKSLTLFVAISAVGLVACSRNTPPADSLPVPATAETTAPAAAAGTTTAAPSPVDLLVEPGVVHMCDGQDRVVSTVKWRVDDAAVSTVRIEVDSTQDPERKTFAAGGATGEAKTGDWVVAGVRFHLVDATTGKELASHEVTGLPCQ